MRVGSSDDGYRRSGRLPVRPRLDIVLPGMDWLGTYPDPDELAAFVAAVESGTVGAAADALELTQSAASKRLQGLERRLGTSLLERGRFGVRATDAGRL